MNQALPGKFVHQKCSYKQLLHVFTHKMRRVASKQSNLAPVALRTSGKVLPAVFRGLESLSKEKGRTVATLLGGRKVQLAQTRARFDPLDGDMHHPIERSGIFCYDPLLKPVISAV